MNDPRMGLILNSGRDVFSDDNDDETKMLKLRKFINIQKILKRIMMTCVLDKNCSRFEKKNKIK